MTNSEVDPRKMLSSQGTSEETKKGLYAEIEAACPHSKAEQERRRNEKGGMTLAEFWRRLNLPH